MYPNNALLANSRPTEPWPNGEPSSHTGSLCNLTNKEMAKSDPSSHTGFLYIENLKTGGVGLVVSVALLFGTGTTQLPLQHSLEQNTFITETELYQSLQREKSFIEKQSSDEQLEQVRRFMGINILELAAILHVSRPTVYGWAESKEIKLRKKNQERLNKLYEIGKYWQKKQVGHFGSYLHKPLGVNNVSLFTLLKSNQLNLEKIYRQLDNIGQLIIAKRQKDAAHEVLLRKHGFKPMSKEDMEDRLNDIHFLD